VCVGQDFL
jgi:hypothetical protein